MILLDLRIWESSKCFSLHEINQISNWIAQEREIRYKESKSFNYLLISRYSCPSCSRDFKSILSELEGCEKIYIITGDQIFYSENKDKYQTILDEKYVFDYLPCNFAGTNLISIENNKLEIKSFGIKRAKEFKEEVLKQ